MSKINLKKLILFSLILLLFVTQSFAQTDKKIKFDYVKLDNSLYNWGQLKVEGGVEYDYLDFEGLPINLAIQLQIKLITIKYSYKTATDSQFRYKLLGLDGGWSSPSLKNEVSYFNLAPGKYTFIVQLMEKGKIINQNQFRFELLESRNNTVFYYLVTFLLYTLILSIFFSFRNGHLKRTKKLLEQTVKLRTAEIVLQKDEISLQKHIVEVKHREISDSINYAKRIQSALLTSQEYWDAISPNNFVIWRPKDVVSGDFHWAYQITIGNKQLMAEQEIAVWCASDCTGHGVPGAFMSMLGMSFLNEIVIENVNLKPADILNKLRRKIISALEHGGTGNIEQKDGMDMALCVWHKNTNVLEYAGANNPAWIIRPIKDTRAHEILELKANRMPVGYHYDTKEFTSLKFQLQKDDAIYLFTDGFVDQFGGPDGKKYKTKKFKEMLLSIQHLNMKDQALMINKEFNDWRGNNEQIDDLCLVGIKVV
jgi:serine phosphatase RsbU (regulator of sigma subunit)